MFTKPRLAGCLLLILSWENGCAQSAYDFPVATMIGPDRGYSMTGFVKSGDDASARPRILRRLEGVCPQGAEIVDLKTTRADAAIGTKILRYEALAVCKKP